MYVIEPALSGVPDPISDMVPDSVPDMVPDPVPDPFPDLFPCDKALQNDAVRNTDLTRESLGMSLELYISLCFILICFIASRCMHAPVTKI
jgi:hypothetical protein